MIFSNKLIVTFLQWNSFIIHEDLEIFTYTINRESTCYEAMAAQTSCRRGSRSGERLFVHLHTGL
ncbi:hypothetical protein D3C72_720150 [compost metagenome]